MKLLICYSVLFMVNQIGQYYNYTTTFMTSYLDDLLFFPITLSIIALYEKRSFPNYKIPIRHTLIAIVLVSVLFEFIIPKIDPRFTADYFDVVFYALGAILYYVRGVEWRFGLVSSERVI